MLNIDAGAVIGLDAAVAEDFQKLIDTYNYHIFGNFEKNLENPRDGGA